VQRQRTIGQAVHFEGIGLHSGRPARLDLVPAPENTGIVLRAGDPPVDIPLTLAHLAPSRRCTAVARGAARVDTVEHLAAALYGCGVDNVRAEVEGGEIPILDGSAEPFVNAIRRAGVVEQEAPRRTIRLSRPVFVAEENRFALALPAEGLRLTVAVDFREPVGRAVVDVALNEETFARELAPARTFGFAEDREKLLEEGLSHGASEECILVVRDDAYTSSLRLEDEPARHKALDALGDLCLLGRRLAAHVVIVRGGHALHHALAAAIAAAGDEE